MKQKLFTLLTLLCFAVSGAWADTENTPTSGEVGSSGVAIVKTSYTVPGTCNPAGGYTNSNWNSTYMMKTRTNQTATVNKTSKSNCFWITVNDGYTITAATFYLTTNDKSNTDKLVAIYVDDATYASGLTSTIPVKSSASPLQVDITSISATKQIVLQFAGDNKLTQGNIYGTITYTAPATTYTVTYDANGATTGSVPTDATAYESGDEVTVLGNTGSLVKTNYTWSGWNTKADGTGTDRAAASTFNITANTTLYAKWIPDAPATPSFSPASGAIDAGDDITITSSLATTIYYGWSASEAVPGEYSSAAATDGAITIKAPNDASKHYLYAYGSNVTGNSDVFHNTTAFDITIDDVAPTLSSSVPAASATNVAVSGTIVLTMSEAIGTVSAGYFSLTSGSVSSVAIDGSDNTKVNVAYTGLSYNSATTLTVAAGGIKDLAGNSNAEFTLSFTTVKETVANPVINTYGHAFQITCATDGATIYYTVDDDDPEHSASKEEFTLTGNNLLTIPASGTVYAYAEKSGCNSSAVVSQAITVPTVGSTTGNLLMTLQPQAPVTGDDATYDSGFTKGGYTLSNNAGSKGVQLTDLMPHYDYAFKCASGKLTVTPPSDVTIKSVKVYIMKNSNKSTGTVTVGEGYTVTTTSNVVLPRYTYYANGDGVFSEIVLTNTSLTEGAGFEFTINSQCRVYVEVYGATSAEVESITRAKTYTTYIPSHNLDFTGHTKLTAYIATAATASTVTMTPVNKVPAGTPIVLKTTDTSNAITVPVTTSTDDVSSNKLKIGDGVASIGGTGKYDYILSDGLFHHASAGVLPAGKCYLHLDAAPEANELTMDFGDEAGDVTGITTISSKMQYNGEYYNLNGQRVAQPTKGLYIVNGKKVIVK